MRALQGVLAVVAWLAAVVATAGAAMVNPPLMGVAGLVCATAALLWGLVAAIRKPRRIPPPWVHHSHGPGPVRSDVTHWPPVAYTVIRGGRTTPPWRDEAHRPFWDTDVMGAPE